MHMPLRTTSSQQQIIIFEAKIKSRIINRQCPTRLVTDWQNGRYTTGSQASAGWPLNTMTGRLAAYVTYILMMIGMGM